MTEQEYIDATDLAKLRSIQSIMRDITPNNSKVIDSDEFGKFHDAVYRWTEELNKRIKIDDGGG